MRNFKRSVAVTFAIVILTAIMPISTLTMTVNATGDEYYSKYGVTYNQLFTLYPTYLTPDAEHRTVGNLTECYYDVINSYSAGDNFIASYMYSLKNSFSILGREFLVGLGWAQSTEETLVADTGELLMQNICNADKAMSAAVNEVSDNFKIMKKIYKTTTKAEKKYLLTT